MKKYKLRKLNIRKVTITILLIFLFFFCFGILFKINNNKNVFSDGDLTVFNNKENKKVDKHKRIIKYINDNSAEYYDFDNVVTSVIVKESDRYLSKIFNYQNGKELSYNSLIKKECESLFIDKINELIKLKYPKFISDILITGTGNNVYLFKDNELVIYFYDYVITPAVNEELFLKVNYNEIYQFLEITVKLDKEWKNEDGFDINSNKKLIAVTFDDGPSGYTNGIVDDLYNNKANATFFVLGQKINSTKDIINKSLILGNEIGYHSYAHKSFTRQKTQEMLNEFNMSNELLISATGKPFSIVRPPYGSKNESVINKFPLPIILWQVDTNDWRYKDVDYLVNHVLTNATDGDIILFHDMYKTSAEAINKLLPELYVRGYQLVTVSDLAKTKNVTLEAHNVYRKIIKAN